MQERTLIGRYEGRRQTRRSGHRVVRATIFVAVLAVIALLLVGCPNPVVGGDSPGDGNGAGDEVPGNGDAPQVTATPVFTPEAGSFSQDITVSLASQTADATIHYTTDGSDPDAGSPTFDTGAPIPVTGDGASVTVRAFAVAPGHDASAITEATYTIDYGQVSTPQFDPPPGTYESEVTVMLSTMTAGATIHYTTDGSDPTTESPEFDPDVPIVLEATSEDTSYTLRAIAVADGYEASSVVTAAYTITYVAPTFVVTNPNDSGPGSLRQAVADAPAGSVVTFAGDYHITLAGSDLFQGIVIGRPLTIDATGREVVINAMPLATVGRHFTVNNGASLEIINLELHNGDMDRGASIMLNPGGATLTARDVTFRDNEALAYGGAIYADGGAHIRLENVTFRDNTSRDNGGAIATFNPARIEIVDSTFDSNVSHYEGGAIWISSGEGSESVLEIDNTEFRGNKSGEIPSDIDFEDLGWGGAMITWNVATTVTGSRFIENTAAGSGGAVFHRGKTLTVTDSDFLRNVGGYAPAGTVADGAHLSDGGAIRSLQAQVDIAGTTFDRNRVSRSGAAIAAFEGSLEIRDSEFSNGFAGQDTIRQNSGNGGALSLVGLSDVLVEDTRFVRNTADQWGGAIALGGGVPMHVYRSEFLENTAHTIGGTELYGGGAINVAPNADAYINLSHFVRNGAFTWSSPQVLSANPRPGGAILNSGNLYVASSRFYGNEAHRGGSAIHSLEQSFHTIITSSVFAGNVDPAPTGESRGAVWSNATVTEISNSTLVNNFAGGVGLNATFARAMSVTVDGDLDNSLTRTVDGTGNPIHGIEGTLQVHVTYDHSSGPGLAGSHPDYDVQNRDPAFARLPDPGADGVWRTADDDYGDLRLQAGSPDIGTGSLGALSADWGDADQDGRGATRELSPFDVAGNNRRVGSIDRGAYEQ